jgi:TRAP-type C4-dicarboxylate transport system substrate-binding protein
MNLKRPLATWIDRRRFVQTGLVAALAAPAIARSAHAQQRSVCRIAHSEALGSPMTEYFEKWTGVLNSESGGRIEAQHFPASQLGGFAELIESSRIGTIQVTTGGPDADEAVAPEIAPLGGAPGFIFSGEAHVDRVLQGELGEVASQIARAKTGVEFLAYGEVGFRHVLSKRPVAALEDLAGLKIRVPQLRVWVDFWAKLGANPTPLPFAEQYSALSTGIIDGLEGDFFSALGFKWHEQAKHITLTYHWFLPKAVRVNAAWLDSLPADLNAMVRRTAREVFAEQRATNRANTDAALEQLKGFGVEVRTLDESERKRWVASTESLFAEFGSKSAETANMIARIRDLA